MSGCWLLCLRADRRHFRRRSCSWEIHESARPTASIASALSTHLMPAPCPATDRAGALKTLQEMIAGPAPGLRTQQVEIKYKKPTPRGAVKKSAMDITTDLRPSHSGIFFPRTQNFGLSKAFQEFKSRIPSMAAGFCARAQGRFIFNTPGERSELSDPSLRDRRPRDTNNFASLEKLFFHRPAFVV